MRVLVISLLMLSVLCQSLLAVAQSMDLHTFDAEHVQTPHDHSQDTKPSGEQHVADDSGHNVADCHHCGHCSGTHLNWLSGNWVTPTASFTDSLAPQLTADNLPLRVREFLRPPIS